MELFKGWGLTLHDKLIVAGPCSAESEEQILQTALKLAECNVNAIRAGIWKPRTRPDSFEGVGVVGLSWLKSAGTTVNLPVMVEVASPEHVEACLKHGIDMLWIGARTSVNPFAVQAIADALQGVDIPVLVKNPINPDLGLWIGALERLNKAGITKVAAIHRGFSSYNKNIYRYQPIWKIPIELKMRLPHLPILCDPSHICGNRRLIFSVAQKAMDLLFDGLIIEAHINPDVALSDADQQLTPCQLNDLLNRLKFKKASIDEVKREIDPLREQIDEIDDQLIDILAKRMDITRAIGKCKNQKNISILQPERWKSIVQSRIEHGKEHNLSEEIVVRIFEEIHEESIQQQNSLNNAPKIK